MNTKNALEYALTWKVRIEDLGGETVERDTAAADAIRALAAALPDLISTLTDAADEWADALSYVVDSGERDSLEGKCNHAIALAEVLGGGR